MKFSCIQISLLIPLSYKNIRKFYVGYRHQSSNSNFRTYPYLLISL
nr:MAG TPA: hypothetical protein [Caudoviricetes sp.]